MFNAHVGQEVVCVDTGVISNTGPTAELRKGRIYVIAKIYVVEDRVGVDLHNVPPPIGYSGYKIERFRPVQKRKTDLAIFYRIVNEVTKRAKIGEKV